MRKSDKKIDNQLRLALTDVCEHALDLYSGFEWITHSVDYGSFPKSLRIVCVFDTEQQLRQFNHQGHKATLLAHIKHNLTDVGIVLHNIDKQVSFDTETACQQQHHGNWALRLSATIINNKFH
ncbi:Fis family transcriptional regulator [Shewanella sp.]|uniref:Fis family transcriptional regulator n=1 Tax=Shewanella sp. TaxID=50422 RepID=UPI0035698B24